MRMCVCVHECVEYHLASLPAFIFLVAIFIFIFNSIHFDFFAVVVFAVISSSFIWFDILFIVPLY